MKKILVLLLGAVAIQSFAADTESSCMQYHKQIKANRTAMEAAYQTKDACTMGKLMIQNRAIFESHQACFPKMEEMMQRMKQMDKNTQQ